MQLPVGSSSRCLLLLLSLRTLEVDHGEFTIKLSDTVNPTRKTHHVTPEGHLLHSDVVDSI